MALTSKLKIQDRKTRVFISYSRKDKEFATLLHDQLAAASFQPMLDQTDIAPGEAWQDRLSKLILQADAFVFCVSPNSAASKICHWEVDESQRLAKRLVPVVVDPVDTGELPDCVSKLNFIFFSDNSFDDAFAKLQSALNSDLGWLRQHTKIAELADDWEARGRSKSRLLAGPSLSEAEGWVAKQPANTNPPSLTQLQFIAASRKGATRRQRYTLAGAVTLTFAALGLFAWGEINRQRTQAAYDTATTVANSMVDDLAAKFKDTPGVPPEITSAVLEKAFHIQDTLMAAGVVSDDMKVSAISALNELIKALLFQGKTSEALDYAEKAEKIAGDLAQAKPKEQMFQTNYAVVLQQVGEVKSIIGKNPEAQKDLEKAAGIHEALLVGHENDLDLRSHAAASWGSLGSQYEKTGDTVKAETAFRKQLEYYEKVAASINVNIAINKGRQSNLAAAYDQLGKLLFEDPSDAAKHDEAVALLRKDVAISENLDAQENESIDTRDRLGIAYSNLAKALIVVKQDAEAEALLKKFLTVADALYQSNQQRDDLLVHFSVANSQLGHFYYDQNKLELATPYLAADLDASRKIADKDKTSADKKFDLAKSLLMMASINQNLQGNLDEASTLMADLAKDHALTPGEADLAQGIENLKASLPAK